MGTPIAPDERLMAAARKGDTAAFGRLVADCQASVRALGRRLTGSVSDGDDIAQAAFLIAWNRRADWRGGSFRGWVCAIAYREFLQQHRRKGRVTAMDPADLEALSQERLEDAGAEHEDLLRAFAALEPGERDAIALCLGAGLSHGEAAEAMNAPLGTVKSWVARGRQKLQTLLAAYRVA